MLTSSGMVEYRAFTQGILSSGSRRLYVYEVIFRIYCYVEKSKVQNSTYSVLPFLKKGECEYFCFYL